MSIENIGSACVGCTICEEVCPFDAIKICYNREGFLYPEIDKTKCVECELCEKKCPACDNNIREHKLLKAFYGKSLEQEIVSASSSGGVFSALAKKVLLENGIVYGAIFDRTNKEIVYSNTKRAVLDEIRRSKYVASNPVGIFPEVKKDLLEGRKVLFCGLPCHVAGLLSYLDQDFENLITCDFICGGASSARCFKEHLLYLEKKYSSSVLDINFRPKLYGWKLHSIQIDFANGKSYKNYGFSDTYFRGYIYEKATCRESCYNCKFKNSHMSDIILADFWGYKQMEEIVEDDDTGLSLVMANTSKGEKTIQELDESNVELTEISLKYVEYNFTKQGVQSIPVIRSELFNTMENIGFEKAAKKVYMKRLFKFRLRRIAKFIIKGRR